MRDVVGTSCSYIGDPVGDVAPGVHESAAGLDGLKMLLGLLRQLLGEVFDEPRTAGRVQHPSYV